MMACIVADMFRRELTEDIVRLPSQVVNASCEIEVARILRSNSLGKEVKDLRLSAGGTYRLPLLNVAMA